jgi:hypothetical protein
MPLEDRDFPRHATQRPHRSDALAQAIEAAERKVREKSRSAPLLRRRDEFRIRVFTASPLASGQFAGSQSGFGNVASRSRVMPGRLQERLRGLAENKQGTDDRRLRAASVGALKVPRTAEPASMTSSTIATRLPLMSGATVSGRR